MVIVILGILAATAAPKFINLQDDARAATVEAVKGAMESASAFVHAKSLIDGSDRELTTVNLDIGAGQIVDVINEWPINLPSKAWNIILEVNPDEFTLLEGTFVISGFGIVYAYPTQASVLTISEIVASACYTIYTESISTDIKPVIDAVVAGC